MKVDVDVRERLALAREEALQRIDQYQRDIGRCLRQGLAWDSAIIRTHRSRLASVLTDLKIIDRLNGVSS